MTKLMQHEIQKKDYTEIHSFGNDRLMQRISLKKEKNNKVLILVQSKSSINQVTWKDILYLFSPETSKHVILF